jgi:signal transduction histidine kinase
LSKFVTSPSSVLFSRVGVRARTLTGFLALAVLATTLGGYGLITIQRLNDSQHTVYTDVFGGTHLLATYIDRTWHTRRDVTAYTYSTDPAARQALREQIVARDAELATLAEAMDQADTDREDVQTLARLREAWHAYAAWRDALMALRDADTESAASLGVLASTGAPFTANVDSAIDEFLNRKHDVGGALEQDGQASYQQAVLIGVGVSAAMLVLAFLAGMVISERVATTAAQVAAAAKGLAKGELEQRIDFHSNDELGQMADAMREMIAYHQHMAQVAHAISRGDLSQTVTPASERDVLGNAFQQMGTNLRLLVGQLEEALARTRGLLEAKEQDAETIRRQVEQLSRLLEQNESLHQRLRRSAARTTALNEQALRRIGADLHDGPAQALAFAVLRLDSAEQLEPEVEQVRTVIRDALADLRAISCGLRLPELESLSIREVIARAARDHERQSGTPVQVMCGELHGLVPLPVKIAAFRALLEALSNATRHGGGVDVRIEAGLDQDGLVLTVSDGGPGLSPGEGSKPGHLGLASMRERAELLGGRFQIESSAAGTAVHLSWPLPPDGQPRRTGELVWDELAPVF